MVSVNQHQKTKKNSLSTTTSTKKKFGVVKRLQKQGGWTQEEDSLLLQAVKKFKERNWNAISACVPTRTATQCLHRFRKVLDPSISKSPWTQEEDNLLLSLAEKHGARSWSVISSHMPNRNAKQVRERYMNHLAPGIKKGVWEQSELDILVDAQKKLGNKWSKISQLVEGRSPNACKNQFHAYQQRLKKGIKPRKTKATLNPPAPESAPKKQADDHSVEDDMLEEVSSPCADDVAMSSEDTSSLLDFSSKEDQEATLSAETKESSGLLKTASYESLNSMGGGDYMYDVYDNCPEDVTQQPQFVQGSQQQHQPQASVYYAQSSHGGAPFTFIAPSQMQNSEGWMPMPFYGQPAAQAQQAQQQSQQPTHHHQQQQPAPMAYPQPAAMFQAGGTHYYVVPSTHMPMYAAPPQAAPPVCSCGASQSAPVSGSMSPYDPGYIHYFASKIATNPPQRFYPGSRNNSSLFVSPHQQQQQFAMPAYSSTPAPSDVAQSNSAHQVASGGSDGTESTQKGLSLLSTPQPSPADNNERDFSISPLPTNFGESVFGTPTQSGESAGASGKEFADFSSRHDPMDFTDTPPISEAFITGDEDLRF